MYSPSTQAKLAAAGQPTRFGQNLQIFSESSEDDAMREENDDAVEM